MLKRLYEYYLENRKEKKGGQFIFPPCGYYAKRASHKLSLTNSGKFRSFSSVDINVFLPDAQAPFDQMRAGRTLLASPFSGNLIYVFGGRRDGKKFRSGTEKEKFNRFLELHEEILEDTGNKKLKALVMFLRDWKNKSGSYKEALRNIKEALKSGKIEGDHIIFQIDDELLHEQPDLIKYWDKKVRDFKPEAGVGVCSITGERQPLRTLHGKITGISNTAANGGSLISFNHPAHESYSGLASIGCNTEFGYRTVLNHFTQSNSNIVKLGRGEGPDVVFWTMKNKNNLFSEIIKRLFWGEKEEKDVTPLIKNALMAIREGKMPDELPEKNDKFCLAYLSGNNGRIFVRDFVEHSLEEVVSGINQHSKDTAVMGCGKDAQIDYPSLISYAMATVSSRSNISPSHNVYKDLFNSILEKTPYPFYIASAILHNALNKPDGLTLPRVSFLRGYLCRKYRLEKKEEIPMLLDQNRNSLGYQLGRLLDHGTGIQAISIGGIGSAREPNSSLSDNYRGRLSSFPKMVFGAITEKIEYHLSKIKRMSFKRYIGLDREYRQMIEKISAILEGGNFPDILDTDQRAEFALGFNMQRTKRFTKKAPQPNQEKEETVIENE